MTAKSLSNHCADEMGADNIHKGASMKILLAAALTFLVRELPGRADIGFCNGTVGTYETPVAHWISDSCPMIGRRKSLISS